MKIWFLRISVFATILLLGFVLAKLLGTVDSIPTNDYFWLAVMLLYFIGTAFIAYYSPKIKVKVPVNRIFLPIAYFIAGFSLAGIYTFLGRYLPFDPPFFECGIVYIQSGPDCIFPAKTALFLALGFSLLLFGLSLITPQNLKHWFFRVVTYIILLSLTVIILLSVLVILVGIFGEFFCINYPIGFEQSCVFSVAGRFLLYIFYILAFILPALISLKLIKRK